MSQRDNYFVALIFFMILGVFAGLVASTGNPLTIAVAFGLIVAGGLFARFDLVVWIVLIGNLFLNGLIGLLFPSLTKIAWLFSLLGFFLLGHTILTRWTLGAALGRLPNFLVFMFVMMGLGTFFSFFGHGSVLEIIAGFKRYFQMWGLMLALALMPVSGDALSQYHRWFKSVFIISLIQLPFALFERIVLVPKRIGMGGGVVPIDIVSGTFEASLEGGGSSSVMVMFLIPVLAYVFSTWKDAGLTSGRMAVLVILLGSPLFLGETKIALVLLPIMFSMVFASEIRRNPASAVIGLLFAAAVTVVLAWIYFSVFASGTLSAEQQFQKAIDYNFGNVGYYDRYSLNRTTATTFWFGQHGLQNPVETLFGHGIGSSYSGAGSLIPGHLNSYYPFMAINLTGLSTLLWDTGVLGTALFFGGLFGAWRASSRLVENVFAARERAELNAIRMSIICIAFSMFYSNSLFAGLSHETIFAVTFGYLGWLVRREQQRSERSCDKNANSATLSDA